MKTKERAGRIAGLFLALVMSVTSCYDDSALVERVTQLEYNLEALQLTLTEELNALNALMKESIYIKTCTKNDDGSYALVLSSGDKFTVYPDQSLESVVTYISMSGTKYWAYYDENGKAQLIYDSEGLRIPISIVPKVVLEDGVNYLVFGTERFPLSGNSVFSDYELHMDEQGDVTAATFTFGDDLTFTIPVGNGNGVRFVYQDIDQFITLNEQFVSYGRTEDVMIQLTGVVDYVWKEPKGWTVDEYEDEYGYTYLSITAPSKEDIETGKAVENGVLKVVSVLEGNGAGVSRLEVTANPFKKMTLSAGTAAVDICFGLQKYAYGVCTEATFDEAAIIAKAEEMLTTSSTAAGYGMASAAIEVSMKTLYGSEMTPGEEYVFWALPAVYSEEEGFDFLEGTIQVKNFVYTTLLFELDQESVTFRDATVKMDLKGASEYYGGIFAKSEAGEGTSLFSNIIPYINGGEIAPKTAPMSYEGSAFAFAGASLVAEPNTAYVVWLIVPEKGQTQFEESDVRYYEFTTDQLSSGSSVAVAVENLAPGYVDAKATLKAEGAELIFYSFLKSTTAAGYNTEELKVKYLLENGQYARSNQVEAVTDGETKLDPGVKMTLFALAVDPDGSYGAVKVETFTTKTITYNSDLAVSLEVAVNEPNNLVVNVSSASEGVDYIYWIGKTSESFWTSSSTLGGTEAKASKYMFLNPDNSRFVRTASNYPIADGKVVFDDLALKADYVLVVMARKEIGSEMSYSSAKVLKFTTKSMSLGTIVTQEGNPTAWEAAKPTITWLPEKFTAPAGMMTATMAYQFEKPVGVSLTYYVMTGTESYFNDGDEETVIPMDDLIISIVEMSNEAEDANRVIQNFDSWIYPDDYMFTHYSHGFSMYGHGVIFPDQAAHDAICDCGGCKTGTITVNKVENLPWEQKAYYYSDCPLEFMSDAVGTAAGIDKVYVTCRDAEGNFYEPYIIDVPFEHFENANSRDE